MEIFKQIISVILSLLVVIMFTIMTYRFYALGEEPSLYLTMVVTIGVIITYTRPK